MIGSQRRKSPVEIHYLIAEEKEMSSYSPDSYSQLREAFTLNVKTRVCVCEREREQKGKGQS